MQTESLLARQNPDGGWPYVRGNSWTEPSVYAVMALLAGKQDDAASRGLDWLASVQRADGGWAPQAGVDESAWVTGLVALLPARSIGTARHAAAIYWLLGSVGYESTVEYRVREWLLGNRIPPEQKFIGWPWIPGAAAWVGPTSIALMALEKENRYRSSAGISNRIAQGQRFLLGRVCRGGGWNHGSARALGYDSDPYPETTGIALAALRGVRAPEIELSVDVARGFLGRCRSADGINWLRLGLAAHGGLPPGFRRPPELACRTVCELALDILIESDAAAHRFFWE